MAITFRLTDGTVVVAAKDCGCRDHDGPCWLYDDDLWRARNNRLRADGNIRGFIVTELARLREKRWHMEREKIEEIIR